MLRTLAISPTKAAPRAVLFMAHGFSVHCMRNEAVLGQIAAAGYLVYTYDCHGHGASEPSEPRLRAYVNDPQDLVDDLVDFTQHVLSSLKQAAQHTLHNKAIPGGSSPSGTHTAPPSTSATSVSAAASDVVLHDAGAHVCSDPQSASSSAPAAAAATAAAAAAAANPQAVVAVGSGGVVGAADLAAVLQHVFVGGESMGGMTAALAVVQQPHLYRGLILCSALTHLGAPPGMRTWAEFLRMQAILLVDKVAPAYAPVARRPIEAGMRCQDGIQEMYQDKLWYRGPIKVRTIVSLHRGCRMLTEGRATIRLPIYAQHGTADMTCSFTTIQHFLAAVATPVEARTLFVVEGGLHDLNHDPETAQCVAALIQWLDHQCS